MLDFEKLGAFYLGRKVEPGARHSVRRAGRSALTEVRIKARTADVQVPLCGLLWMPYRNAGDGRLEIAWQP